MHKRYTLTILIICLSWLALIGIINICIDPYKIFKFITIDKINSNKPFQQNVEQVFKPIEVKRQNPDLIILGSSRVQYGFSPNTAEHLTSLKSYNFGTDGASAYEIKSFATFALNNTNTKVILVGLDLMAFNGARPLYNARFNQNRMDIKLEQTRFGYLNTQEIFKYVFAWKTISDSFRTLVNQNQAPFYDDKGFIPNQNFSKEKLINYESIFKATLKAYGAEHLNKSSEYFHANGQINVLNFFDQLIQLGKNRNITYIIIINPMHKLFLDELDRLGKTQQLKNWVNEINRRIILLQQHSPCKIHYANYLTDNRNDEIFSVGSSKKMLYWSDAYHFSKFYGDEIMREVFSGLNFLKAPNKCE
jgi:hypothetical protein